MNKVYAFEVNVPDEYGIVYGIITLPSDLDDHGFVCHAVLDYVNQYMKERCIGEFSTVRKSRKIQDDDIIITYLNSIVPDDVDIHYINDYIE